MKFPRMTNWMLASLGLAVLVLLLAPQQLPVTLYKLSLITVAIWIGYWADRGLFPYARPDALAPDPELDIADQPCSGCSGDEIIGRFYGHAFEAAMIRRAIIVAACVVGVALGA